MLRSVFRKTLRDQRGALVWWTIGLVATCLLTTSFYPSIRENSETLNDLVESLPVGFRNAFLGSGADLFSPSGYLQVRLFSVFVPLLLLVYAIGAGARATAGEEERKTLDILLSTPVRRRRVLAHKAAAMLVATAGLCLVIWLTLALTGPPFDVSIGLDKLLAAAADAFLLAAAFGAIALAIGAATGRRGLAIGVTSGIAAGSYLLDVLALSVDGLDWLQRLLPFYHYRAPEPLMNGLDTWNALVLGALAAVAFTFALVAFERRDIAA